MKELSLNILDIAMNSVKAGATMIAIDLYETAEKLKITITDNGCGMTKEQVSRLRDPFFTSRTTRKVGLGVPFLVLAAEQTGGSVEIESKSQEEFPKTHGTTVSALFMKSSIDFTPLGDIVSTLVTLIQGNPQINFEFSHIVQGGTVRLSLSEIREFMGEDIDLSSPEILAWITENLGEQYSELNQ